MAPSTTGRFGSRGDDRTDRDRQGPPRRTTGGPPDGSLPPRRSGTYRPERDRDRDDRASSRAGTRSGGYEGRPRRAPFPPQNAQEARSPKSWGSLARKGTRQLNEEGAGPASVAWREAVARSRTPEGRAEAPAPWEPDEVWVRDDDVPPAAKRPQRGAKARKPESPAPAPVERPSGRKPKTLPTDVQSELAESVSTKTAAARLQQRMTDATGAFERDRYGDAARMLKPLAEQAPGATAVRELYGITLYRLGRWDAAIKELEAFRQLDPDSVDQHPTLADCYRAKKRWRKVDELWEELRRASPAPDLLAEGRLVYAGSLAERGQLAAAIELLERAKTDQKKPRPDHLRTWYALADLYERAGEVPRARELFRRVLRYDPDLADTAERLRAIGG